MYSNNLFIYNVTSVTGIIFGPSNTSESPKPAIKLFNFCVPLDLGDQGDRGDRGPTVEGSKGIPGPPGLPGKSKANI